MRVKLFDNELTITAIYNLIRYLNQVNEEYDEFKENKSAYEAEERKKKEVKFKQDLESRRNKNFNKAREDQITKHMLELDQCITETRFEDLEVLL